MDVRDGLLDAATQGKRYELIAAELEQAIAGGRLRLGDRLPTVRQLASDLSVSTATVASAYKLLQRNGLVQGGVGRGTFVAAIPPTAPPLTRLIPNRPAEERRAERSVTAWRKRALNSSAAYLRSAYPAAANCGTGRPDPDLLPVALLQRAWQAAVADLAPSDLQYAGPEPIPQLVDATLPYLAADGIVTEMPDFIVGSSAQQFMMLGLQVIAEIIGDPTPLVAVEEPGYPTILDSYERAGCKLVGMDVDAHGVTPESLDAALAADAKVVLLTPRAHNPTGASWTAARRTALADVLAAHRGVYVIEDDQFAGLTWARPGSLISDPRIADRVLYVRSFSKSIAPDLRITIGVAHSRLRFRLVEAKGVADGWTSRLIQRVLASLLTDEDLPRQLDTARATYAARRDAALRVLEPGLAARGGGVAPGDEGLNIWLWLPPGIESFEVLEQAANLGMVAASGEAFFIRPGHGHVIRMNAGAVDAAQAAIAAEALLTAATRPSETGTMAMVV